MSSSDLYVQSISRGTMTIKRRPNRTGEIMVCFNDPNIATIHITNDDPVVVTDHTGATAYAIQRSNIRVLLGLNHIDVVKTW